MELSTVVQIASTIIDPKLYEALTLGKSDLLGTLLERNVNILQQVTPMNDTTIHIAARGGHLNIVKTIHSRFSTLFTQANSVGDTPLHIAARAGHYEVVNFLIGCAKSHPIEAVNIIRKQNRDQDNIMHDAVRSCHLDIVKLLIKEDPELLCMVNFYGESPLHVAVEKGKVKIVEAILESDHFSYKGPNGRTALHAAIIHKRKEITRLLLEKTEELVKMIDNNSRSAIHFASALGYLDYVQMILKRDTSTISYFDKTGYAPIHIAARFGRLNIIKEFISIQSDLEYLLDGSGRNILHIAVEHHHVTVVKYILQHNRFGGLLNGKDNDGNTPLHQAATSGDAYMGKVLIRDKRIDRIAINRKQHTALEIARTKWDESKENEKGQELEKKERALTFGMLFRATPPWCNHGTTRMETLVVNRDKIRSHKEKANIYFVVATLVATVTFTAGLTLPGGYQSDGPHQGMPTQKQKIFDIFVSDNAIAMYLSMGAVISFISLQFREKVLAVAINVILAQSLTFGAFLFMQSAFISGYRLIRRDSKVIEKFFGTHKFVHLGALCLIIMQIMYTGFQLKRKFVFTSSRKSNHDISILFCYGV